MATTLATATLNVNHAVVLKRRWLCSPFISFTAHNNQSWMDGYSNWWTCVKDLDQIIVFDSDLSSPGWVWVSNPKFPTPPERTQNGAPPGGEGGGKVSLDRSRCRLKVAPISALGPPQGSIRPLCGFSVGAFPDSSRRPSTEWSDCRLDAVCVSLVCMRAW